MEIHRHIFLLSDFENTFFSFHLRCVKNENLWCFSPYPVTTTIIWPTSDRIPHSLIFKRMQIKRIADNVRALFFKLINWNKEPDEKKIYRLTKFFHKLDNNKCKCTRAHVQENKSIYLSIYISIWKPFWKRVYIYICPIQDYALTRTVMLHLLMEWLLGSDLSQCLRWLDPVFFGGGYHPTLKLSAWYPHLYFYRKSNT